MKQINIVGRDNYVFQSQYLQENTDTILEFAPDFSGRVLISLPLPPIGSITDLINVSFTEDCEGGESEIIGIDPGDDFFSDLLKTYDTWYNGVRVKSIQSRVDGTILVRFEAVDGSEYETPPMIVSIGV